MGMKMKKQNVRTLALIVCTFTYLLIGAAIFDVFESSNELQEKHDLATEERIIQLRYNISDDDMEHLRVTIIRAKPYRAGVQWKFTGAFYFALSVITTIGYGHSAPRTPAGKGFCIGYALIGIPLNIVMFQSIGERFNIGITLVLKKMKECSNRKRVNVTQTELMIVAFILCSAVLAGGAVAFHLFEGWPIMDAFYYCFITMSTIGFGDFVALQNTTMLALETRPDYVAFSILYILFGLTVFAAALNLMVLRLLTMNTEDERKDELQAIEAKRQAVKVEGDIITQEAQNAVVSSLTRDVEGIQIEAIDDNAKSHIYHNCHRKVKDSSRNSNGVLPNYSRQNNNVRSMDGVSNQHISGHATPLESNCEEETSNAPRDEWRQEEVVGVETVLASPSIKLHKKRGSV